MLWARDQARARALFSEAAAAIAQSTGKTERGDRDEAETMARLRRELVLTAARHVYERAGFRLTSSEARRNFGKDVISEHWDLVL